MKIHIITKSLFNLQDSFDRIMFMVNDFTDEIKLTADVVDIEVKVHDKIVYAVIKYKYKD